MSVPLQQDITDLLNATDADDEMAIVKRILARELTPFFEELAEELSRRITRIDVVYDDNGKASLEIMSE